MDNRKVTAYWTLSGCFTLLVVSFFIFTVHYFSKDWISNYVKLQNGTVIHLQKGFFDNCAKLQSEIRYHCIPADETPEFLNETGIQFIKHSNYVIYMAHYFGKAIISLSFLCIVCMIFLCRETDYNQISVSQRIYSLSLIGLLFAYLIMYLLVLLSSLSPLAYWEDKKLTIPGKIGFAVKINLIPFLCIPLISFIMRYHIIVVCQELFNKYIHKNGPQNDYTLTEVQPQT
uniref:Transmembrane protein n=1 Tax=Strongyloides papillosus TaxID=174720 RepID=A0A0N5CH23_STREA